MADKPCSICHGRKWRDKNIELPRPFSGIAPARVSCDHCDGSGIEPKVELVSPLDWRESMVWDIVTDWDMGEVNLENFLRFVDAIQSNARAYQRKEDAQLCKDMSKRESMIGINKQEANWRSIGMEQAAKAIEEGK